VKEARELGFNAIVAGFFGERLAKAIEEGNKHGVEIYLDIEFLGGGRFTQVMTQEEEQLLAGKKRESGKDVATWIPGERGDPFGLSLWCFARPEALEHGKAKIRKYLDQFAVHGVCLDAIGFRNQYGCHCEHCKEQRKVLARGHPEFNDRDRSDLYAEQVLTKFISELAKFTRSLRPDIKLATHIEPTFAPNPTFARGLPVDYWMTSVSYYSKPHWPLDTVKQLSEEMARARGKAVGVPYLGFIGGDSAKPVARLGKEFQAVAGSGVSAIALFELSDILRTPGAADLVRESLAEKGKK